MNSISLLIYGNKTILIIWKPKLYSNNSRGFSFSKSFLKSNPSAYFSILLLFHARKQYVYLVCIYTNKKCVINLNLPY